MKILIVLMIFLFPVNLAWAGSADAVVKIYATKGVRSGLGTGFFCSKEGQIVTAYHVVEQASHIEVFDHSGRNYDDIVIQFISPEHDLAVLRARDVPPNLQILQLVKYVPSPKEDLNIFSYPRGSSRMRLRGHVTSDGFIDSTELRTKGGGRLFQKNIHILPIAFEGTYGGMSGGPVVSSQGVIGIFSGSWNIGAGIGWVIPTKYVSSNYLTKINLKPHQIADWPKLALMADGWQSLRKLYKLDSHLEAMLQKYWEHTDSMASIYASLPNVAMRCNTAAQNLRYILSTAKSDPSMATKNPSEILGLEYPYKAFLESLEKFDILVNRQPQLTQEIGQTYHNMYNWVEKGIQDKETAQLLDRGIKYLNVRYASVPHANPHYIGKPIEEINAESAKIGQLMDYAIRAGNASDFASRMVNAIDAFKIHLTNWTGFEVVSWMNDDITRWRSYGDLFEEVAYRPAQ